MICLPHFGVSNEFSFISEIHSCVQRLQGQDSIAPVMAKMAEILSLQMRVFTFQMWEDHHAVQIFFECD
ncbi:hypothetical protein LguiA_002430 [Lonicera macranthoides]